MKGPRRGLTGRFVANGIGNDVLGNDILICVALWLSFFLWFRIVF